MVRVRIAPSPTGKIHVGTIRTALFNFLFARNQGGKFIVRIEDTDTERSKKEYENLILEGLHWIGLEWNEGPDIGGPYSPYHQMERLHLYKEYAQKLLTLGKAYYCYCTPQELAEERQKQQAEGKPPRYSKKCFYLSAQQKNEYEKAGRPKAIRFALPAEKVIHHDIIRGQVEFDTSLQSDPVIIKSNSIPTFNFANVIDDYSMKISHVIRGEEFIPSMPQQILLYRAFNFPLPHFAHLPLILNPNRTKMSKRRNEGVLETYIEKGYLKEALINFLVLLGWSPGTNEELFTLEELIKVFSLERLQPNPATLQPKKLDWFNGQYLRKLPLPELRKRCEPFIPLTWQKDTQHLEAILALVQDRLVVLSELKHSIAFFFEAIETPATLLRTASKNSVQQTIQTLDNIISILTSLSWEHTSLENTLRTLAETVGWKTGELFMLTRIAVTGSKTTPPLFDTLQLLGKEITLQRLQQAKYTLEHQ